MMKNMLDCAVCGPSEKKILRCENCMDVGYCGRGCQEKGWKDHKQMCAFTT